MSKTKKWKYHKQHSYHHIKDNEKVTVLTQLYKVGVYGIIDGNPALQFTCKPSDIVKIEKKLIKAQEKGEIKDLEFNIPITVIVDEDGLYKEYKDE